MNDSNLDELFEEDWGEDHRSGEVAVIGRPNVGKSTLINAILGQKVAIVSPKPQTTRKQQLGIYTVKDAQVLFVDTPGIHKPHHKLGEYMVTIAEQALRQCNLILWIVDASVPPQDGDKNIAETLKQLDVPVFIVLNKTDLPNTNTDYSPYLNLIKSQGYFAISALAGNGVKQLIAGIIDMLPLGPRYYPQDQVSEVNLRFMASEIVREKVMLHTEQEIPHATAVAIEGYKERPDGTHYISAVIYVERDSQRGILIGKNGAMIKKIGTEARQDLETAIEAKVFLELHVKVLKNWREDENLIRRLGYRLPKPEDDKGR